MALYLKRLGREETFYLSPDKDKIVIGRSPVCDISFSSVHISRQHCQILRIPPNGALIIKNIKDTNCTYVNELKLQNSDACAELQVGCCIGLGVPLEHATVAGMRNNNFVFLKLESPLPTNETRQNDTRAAEDQRNAQMEVESQLGEPAPCATLLGHPLEVATLVQDTGAVKHPGYSSETTSHVQGADGNCLVSRQDSQEPRALVQGLRPHLLSSKGDLSSEFLSTRRGSFILQVGPSVQDPSIQDEVSHMPITANNALCVKGRVSQNKVEREDELNDTRQPENNTENSHLYEVEPKKFKQTVGPFQGVDSSHKPKQDPSMEDTSCVREAEDGKTGQASVCENLITENEEPHSPISIDLTQADPDSPVNVDLSLDSSKKHEQKEFFVNLVSTDDDVNNVLSPKRNSSQGEGKKLSGKRKRLTLGEPSSGMSVTEDSEGGSSKKKVKSSSLLHSDKDSCSENDTLGHETKINDDSSKISEHSDSDDDLFVHRRKINKNADKCNANKSKQDNDSDNEPFVNKRKIKQNSKNCVSNKAFQDSGSDEELVIFKRKTNQKPYIIYSSDNDSDFEDVAPRKKSGAKGNLLSLKRCSVNLNRLSCDITKSSSVISKDNCFLKGTSTSTSNNKENVSEDRINHSAEKHINESDSCRLSQKCNLKSKTKRKHSVEEASISHKNEREIMIKQTTREEKVGVQKKSLGEHFSHKVDEVTKREDQGETKSVPLLTESWATSAISVSCSSAHTERSNKLIERDKVSSICNSEKEKKSNKEEQRVNKVEGSIEIEIKAEPVSCEENNDSERDDTERDGVVFMYSQVGDEIWLSSDEEEEAPPPSDPPSTNLDADLIFLEKDEQQPSPMEVSSSPVKEHAELDGNDDVDDDDQWFSILSQSFLESSDEEEKDEDGNKDLKNTAENTVESEPKPGPSGISVLPDNESEDDGMEWWPKLSQGFFDEDEVAEEEDEEKEKAASSNSTEMDARVGDEPISTGGTTDLQSVIEKLRRKGPRTTQLTEPKIPLRHSRKKSRRGSSSSSIENDLYSKTQEPSTIIKKKTNDQKKVEQKQGSSRSAKLVNKQRKQNKNLDLIKTLTSKYNLEAYKTTLECRTKEKHHLITKDKEKSKKLPSGHLANKNIGGHKASENISIQKKKKSPEVDNQDKARPKVAAKVTKKTRSEKLIDVDLFSGPSKRTAPSKRKNFKIPKSSNVGTSCSSKSSEAGGSGLVLNRGKDVDAAGGCGRLVIQGDTEPQPENTSDNAHSEIENLPTYAATTSKDSADKVNEINRDLQKVKLKPSKPKKVHFPEKEEDLVKVMLISPRRKGERTGLPSVRAREVLPEELMLQRQNIPPYYMELFVHHVCRWNYDWLECYHSAQEKYRAGVSRSTPAPPPVVSSTNYPMLILYSSYKDYRETHSSLFYLELWERIYSDWVKRKTSNCGLQSLIEYVKAAFIRTPTSTMKFWTLKLLVAIPQKQDISMQNFRQGTLISLKIRKESKRSVIFGYVDYMMVNNRNMATNQYNQEFSQMDPSFTLGVRVVKEIIETVKPGTVIIITDISYIRPCSRIWESLYRLPLSPLCQHILSPTPGAFSCERKTEYIVKDLPLNEAQKKAVIEVSSKCMFDSHVPKLSLIHGPPGTGKTSTIVALVAQMAMIGSSFVPENMPRCKVLICAPSNAAVDELTLRLIRLRNIGLSLRVVRVGFKADYHPVVRNYTLDQFVNKKVKTELSTPRCESARQEWQRRKFLVEQVADNLEKARKEGRQNEIRQLEVRLNEMARAKAELEKSFINEPSVHEKHQLYQKWQQEFLLNAEIVTTTLNSCVSGTIAEVLGRHPYHFTCCIVDEAGQCQETETLLPLLLGIRKLVLVGDHHQLPATVLSQLALSKNLKQSLFERLYHRLVLELQREDVVHTLNVQYRMHPEIVEWPAHHFYQNKLISDVSIQPFILKPYLIFDLKTSQEQKYHNQEMYNPAEASLMYVLLEVLQPHISNKTVGIITPYQRQRIFLEEKLTKFKGKMDISINTIDGFQGQERDVIILSFVRANNSANIGFLSHRQRLNVALTRAKEVCYIIASLSSLEGNREWHSLIRNGRQRGIICTVTTKEEHDKNFLKSVVEK